MGIQVVYMEIIFKNVYGTRLAQAQQGGPGGPWPTQCRGGIHSLQRLHLCILLPCIIQLP